MSLGHRRSIRYRGFDYSGPGVYFVTLCLHDRGGVVEYGGATPGASSGAVTAPLMLCRIVDWRVELNGFGTVVDRWWRALPERFVGIALDEYVIMPDHFHGIITILEDRPLEVRSTLGQMVAWFKYNSTKEINAKRGTGHARVWQRNYWERIVRNDRGLDAVRRYIRNNPIRWSIDGGTSW